VTEVIHRTVVAVSLAPLCAFAAPDPFEGDPHQLRAWPELRRAYLGAKAQVVFDKRVEVQAPSFADDPMNVPITVRAAGKNRCATLRRGAARWFNKLTIG
jgi:sulfur-oxidizing protein SoxY